MQRTIELVRTMPGAPTERERVVQDGARHVHHTAAGEDEVVHETPEDATAAVDALVGERVRAGFVVPFVPDPVLAAHLPVFLDRLGEGAPEVPSRGELARLEAWFCRPMPPELAAFLRWREARALVYPTVGEWRVWGSEIWLPQSPPRPGEPDNLVEQAILLDQQNYLGTALLELAAGCVWLGSLGNGDGYFAHLDTRHPENTQVVFWDHEERWLSHTIADSLGSLAWANALLSRVSDPGDEPAPPAALAADHARLDGRFRPSWHFSSIGRATGLQTDCKVDNYAQYYLARVSWILALLQNDGVRKLRDVAELFGLVDHRPSTWQAARSSPHLTTNPVTAFYWCWRLWFFAKPELAECLATCASSPSPLIRDLAALVAELDAGRRTLGTIGDVHALRERFLALDLDPDRAEARAAEEAAAAAAAEAKGAADAALAARLAESTDPDVVASHAWQHLGNAAVLGPLLQRLGELLPSLRDDLARLRFVESNAHSRDGHSYSFEREDVLEALSRADRRLAPWLLSGPRDLWPEAARCCRDPRVVAALAAKVDLTPDWLHDAAAALDALGRTGAPDAAAILVDAAARLPWPDDFGGQLRVKDALRAVHRGLGALRAGFEVLAAAADSGVKELVPGALVALGHHGDPRGVAHVAPHLGGGHRDAALHALGLLATDEARALLDREVASLRGAPERTIVARAMRELARDRAGLPVELGVARSAALVVAPNRHTAVELHVAAVVLLTRHAPAGEALSTLHAMLDHEHRAVREAVLDALSALGDPVAPRWCDRAAVDAAYAGGGVDALRDLLDARAPVLRVHVVRKVAEVGGGDVLGERLDRVVADATRCPWYGHGWVRDGAERLGSLLDAVGELGTPRAWRLLAEAHGHPSVLVRAADVFQRDEVKDHLGAAVIRPPPADPSAPTASVTTSALGLAPWLHGVAVKGLAFAGDRLWVASDGHLGWFDADGAAHPAPAPLSTRRAFDVAGSPDGRTLAVASHGGHLDLADAATGALLRELRGHRHVPNFVARVAFSPSGARLASVSDDQTLRFWDVATGAPLGVVEAACDLNAVAWVDEDRALYGGDRVVGLARASGEVVATAALAAAEVAVLPDGRWVAATPKELRLLGPGLEAVGAWKQARCLRLRASPDGRRVFALSYEGADRGLWAWDVATGRRRRWKGMEDDGAPRALALHPVTGLPVAGGQDPRVRRWGPTGAGLPSSARFHPGPVDAVQVVGDEVWTCGAGGVLCWRDGEVARAYPAVAAAGAARSPDGSVVVVARGRAVCGCDPDTGEVRWEVPVERCEGLVGTAAGVVAGSGRGLLFVGWDGSGAAAVPAVSEGWLHHLLPLDGGRVLVSGYRAPELQVWDPARRALVETWPLPERGRADSYGLAVGAGRMWVSRWNDTVEVGTLRPDGPPAWDVRILTPGSRAPVAPDPAGRWLLAGALLLDVASGRVAATLPIAAELTAAAWLDGSTAVVGTKGGRLHLVRVG